MTNPKVMSEEAFNELIDNIEVVERLTLYGRRNIKYYVQLLQQENQKLKLDLRNLVNIIKNNCDNLDATVEEFESFDRWNK